MKIASGLVALTLLTGASAACTAAENVMNNAGQGVKASAGRAITVQMTCSDSYFGYTLSKVTGDITSNQLIGTAIAQGWLGTLDIGPITLTYNSLKKSYSGQSDLGTMTIKCLNVGCTKGAGTVAGLYAGNV